MGAEKYLSNYTPTRGMVWKQKKKNYMRKTSNSDNQFNIRRKICIPPVSQRSWNTAKTKEQQIDRHKSKMKKKETCLSTWQEKQSDANMQPQELIKEHAKGRNFPKVCLGERKSGVCLPN